MPILIPVRRRWKLLAGYLLLTVVIPGASSLRAEAVLSVEYQVKAVFLFNFSQFVTWPPATFTRPDEPFLIGILGDDPFGAFLDETIQGEKMGGHPLVVRRYRKLQDVQGCQILFISRSEEQDLGNILGGLKDKDVLTVGESEDFTRSGGIIGFFMKDKKVRFRVSLEAAKRADISISSKMLRLAEIAKPGKD